MAAEEEGQQHSGSVPGIDVEGEMTNANA